MINLSNDEKELLLKTFEEKCNICLCDIIEDIDNKNIKKLYKELNKHCEENRYEEKSCFKCFKIFFKLF